MDNLIFQEENIKLKNILTLVKKSYDDLSYSLTAIGSENLGKLKDLRDNPETSGADFYFFLEQLNQENQAFNLKDKLVRVEEMANMIKQPYFARIDLVSSTGKSSLYIGKFGFTLDEPIITDWRAKIASIYYRYRYPQKKVTYESQNETYTMDLTLKRTFDIDNSTLYKYYNNDIQLDESEIIFDKLEKRSGGVLEDIVETIQESQLNIIESDPRKICIVQGCVGSGKSTVAIHKLSHIFFNYPKIIRPERSIIIAKNQILISYLSTLFPKLGIFDVRYQTLRELMVHVIFREEIKILYDFSLVDENFKIDSTLIQNISNDLEFVHESIHKSVKNLFDNQDFESFGGYKYSKLNTPYENVFEIITELEEEKSMQKEQFDENPTSAYSILYKENIRTINKILKNLNVIKDNLKVKLFPAILKKYNLDQNRKLNYYETSLYLSIYLDIFGLRNFKKYEYCVVDEGQDFTLLEYNLLGKLILRGRFCILGDLNQSVNNNTIQDWDEIKSTITDAKNAKNYILDTNYRSTKPIIDYANNILNNFTNSYLPKSINRLGSEPVVIDSIFDTNFKETFISEIYAIYENIDKSVGIICMEEEYYSFVDSILSRNSYNKKKIIKLNENARITYIPKGIYYMNFPDCKGLEFSKVIIIGANFTKAAEFIEAKKAFIAVTRAMNELLIYNILK